MNLWHYVFKVGYHRDILLFLFRAAIREARAGSVIASYNEIDGIPSQVNHWLLEKVLRREWAFPGYVTSDGEGLQMLYRTHGVAADACEAARKALAAGVDFDLSDGSVYRTLVQQVKDGTVPISEVDQAAGRVLAAKFRLGLFENPYVDPDIFTGGSAPSLAPLWSCADSSESPFAQAKKLR